MSLDIIGVCLRLSRGQVMFVARTSGDGDARLVGHAAPHGPRRRALARRACGVHRTHCYLHQFYSTGFNNIRGNRTHDISTLYFLSVFKSEQEIAAICSNLEFNPAKFVSY